MTPEFLAVSAGVLLSLAFSYLPKLRDWYAVQSGDTKRGVMLGSLFVVAAGMFGAGCLGYSAPLELPAVSCDQAGVLDLIKILFNAAIANQAAFLLTPKRNG